MISDLTERLLQISSLPGIGIGGLRRLIAEAQRSGATALNSDDRIVASFGRGTTSSKDASGWQRIRDDCSRLGLRIFSPLDREYPTELRRIEDYPPLIYVMGDPESLTLPGCAVVGTREASFLGLCWAKQIAEVVASRRLSVVSGLALGIDTAAHEGALRAGGITVAILAHGLDKITPASNKDLAARIVASGGSLISEHAPGVPPRRAEYVRRNRIQSGMSRCSIVVESAEEGGAIYQGTFTTKQGRALYCVNPDRTVQGSDEFKYGGAKRLMREARGRPLESRARLEEELDRLFVGRSDPGGDALPLLL